MLAGKWEREEWKKEEKVGRGERRKRGGGGEKEQEEECGRGRGQLPA